ncbi:hypothetical protein [Bradyrhizobium cenepequi]|uniref:hypothetical protein n=1 Tax=Bradyrhizobium cenepequi TaxID=2821403 RepID=UPI001CE2FEB7|nr:hypothetical protein [Bradyrhizobium cenepequi]MCA6112533.1 hypothetical protein [Bradyrhizobium cenepequi]
MFFAGGLDGANHVGIAGEFSSVIPGHREAMSPESILPSAQVDEWIPGSRQEARPGMTG